jgi:hypothetical protein
LRYQVGGDREADRRCDTDDDDADPDRLHGPAGDQPVHRLVGDEHGADQQEDHLRPRGQILELLVSVPVRCVGGLVGLAHREQ